MFLLQLIICILFNSLYHLVILQIITKHEKIQSGKIRTRHHSIQTYNLKLSNNKGFVMPISNLLRVKYNNYLSYVKGLYDKHS
jgi:hypothetical protein